jgi:hypothetical protein
VNPGHRHRPGNRYGTDRPWTEADHAIADGHFVPLPATDSEAD